VIAWGPGRVNLIGEHTDYSGGLALPAAIQRGVTVEIDGPAERIELVSDGYGAASLDPDGGGEADGWARYAQAVAAELAELGRPPAGLRGTVRSDLPTGAGLSSSAALEVAVGLALCAVADFELEPLELALACQRAELRAVGVPCGILDQAACVLGRPGHALLLDTGTLEHRLVAVAAEAALLVLDSGVEHSHEGSGYAQRRAELERALALAGATRTADLTESALAGLDDLSARRLGHVIRENARVCAFATALELGDLRAAGALLSQTHASLRDDYEVSVPEIDLLVEIAEAAGAYGARIVGGGFGGGVLALVDVERAEEIGAAVAAEYARRTGIERKPLVAVASGGAAIRR
jgi:galactokinase